ncbi:Fe-S oxidoreductase [Streptomonospora alba]|uniref:Fe-S oxidoreductase n=1 Tax=Streptomonospora alba TaxID=183763 RepID=A0A0C2FG78_9ACTN|nr:FxsB family cyclophane-forming radical SAM/SPASM peptide maturase [Streptomonospora alba]KIH98249.1 Fe-S oxidoreductase [Streptomonospora alba]
MALPAVAKEPPESPDAGARASAGWEPAPFVEFVLKVHSRCNLACSYCYMYEMADQSWRSAPRVISRRTADLAARRIGEHARSHGLDEVTVVLHGGEPLLAGSGTLDHIARRLRTELGETRLNLRMQTNGVLLDDSMLRLARTHGISIGVSIDGGREDHDRHRRFAGGRGSYDDVARALRRLAAPDTRDLFSGLLCTIDLDSDPLRVYEALLEFAPPAIDFLLPHGNWTSPPPGRAPGDPGTPYADWLGAIFDRWYAAAPPPTNVRTFQEISHLLLGGAGRSETLGLSPVRLVVITTDGSLEQVDTLKSAYAGATETGLSIRDTALDAALRHPDVAARQLGVESLSDTCRECPLHRVCGGGYYPHRYSEGSGFANPSVYCPDLAALIRRIRTRLSADLHALRAGTR